MLESILLFVVTKRGSASTSSSGAGKAGIPAVRPIAAFLRPIAARAYRRPARALPVRKAAILARRSDGLSVEWKPLSRLDAADRARMRELAARALEPNVFYEPAFASPPQPFAGRGRAARCWSAPAAG